MRRLKVEGRLTKELVDELRHAIVNLDDVRIDMTLTKIRGAQQAEDAESYLRELEHERSQDERRVFEDEQLHEAYTRLKERGMRKKVF